MPYDLSPSRPPRRRFGGRVRFARAGVGSIWASGAASHGSDTVRTVVRASAAASPRSHAGRWSRGQGTHRRSAVARSSTPGTGDVGGVSGVLPSAPITTQGLDGGSSLINSQFTMLRFCGGTARDDDLRGPRQEAEESPHGGPYAGPVERWRARTVTPAVTIPREHPVSAVPYAVPARRRRHGS